MKRREWLGLAADFLIQLVVVAAISMPLYFAMKALP